MKEHLVTFAVGAGVVYLAAQGASYLNTNGADGKKPLGDFAAQYAAPLVGGLALVLAKKFIGSAA